MIEMMIEIAAEEQQEPDNIFIEKNGITLYRSAWKKLKELSKSSNRHIRISLEPSGCAGVSYTAYMDEKKETDVFIEFGDGISLIVDTTLRFPSQSVPNKFYSDWDFLTGLHLRYEESIMSSQFVMDNPNSERGCSCGISFKPKDYGGKPKSCKSD